MKAVTDQKCNDIPKSISENFVRFVQFSVIKNAPRGDEAVAGLCGEGVVDDISDKPRQKHDPERPAS